MKTKEIKYKGYTIYFNSINYCAAKSALSFFIPLNARKQGFERVLVDTLEKAQRGVDKWIAANQEGK